MAERFFDYFFPAAEVKKGAFWMVVNISIPGSAVRGIVESYLHSVCLDRINPDEIGDSPVK